MRRRAALGLGLFVLALYGCKDDRVRPASRFLDERLGAGQVRAGRVDRESALLGSPLSKGRTGDFKLYNDRIAVIVAAPGEGRGFSPFGGGVVDADRIRPLGTPNASAFGEVIIAFDFLVHHPQSVEVVDNGSSGREARLRMRGGAESLPLYEAVLGSIIGSTRHPLEWSIDYVLEPGAELVRIEHQVKNTGDLDIEVGVIGGFFFGTGARPVLEPGGFSASSSGSGAPYYAAASDEVSYLYTSTGRDVAIIFGESGLVVSTLGNAWSLRAREQKTLVDFLIVGGPDLSATRLAFRKLAGLPTGVGVFGEVKDSAGVAVKGARVHVTRVDSPMADPIYVTRTLCDDAGIFNLSLEPGRYALAASTNDRRTSDGLTVDVGTEPVSGLILTLPATGILAYQIEDQDGARLPAKLSVEPLDAPPIRLARAFGEPDNGDGLYTLELGFRGHGEVALPPGEYRVSVSRGAEYEVKVETVHIEEGGRTPLSAQIARTVATPGWMSSDTHIHAQLSPDSPDSYELKVKAMAVENIELPVSTEHDAIGDFNPAITLLELEPFMRGIVGSEITTTRYGHFNAFPLIQDKSRPFNGRIDWYQKDPAGFLAEARRAPGDPVVQVNHPRSTSIGYFHHLGLDRDRFEASSPQMSFDFDGIEVLNTCGDRPQKDRAELLDWFAFLKEGRRVFATGALDDHHAGQGEMGYPLTYVRTEAARPIDVTTDDFRAAFRAGRLMVSCGPFLTLNLGDAQIGDTVRIEDGRIEVRASVSAPSWMDVDEINLIVNGVFGKSTPVETGNQALRFSGTLSATVASGQDAWVAVWASGDTPHGIWAQHRPSFAFTNPIFIDGDGDGRWR